VFSQQSSTDGASDTGSLAAQSLRRGRVGDSFTAKEE
jgi:hypothetical protein